MTGERSETIAIILAAGQSKRMGETNKLLAGWREKTPLEYVCQAALGSVCEANIVVTGHQRQLVMDAFQGQGLQFYHNNDFASGMASSIKTGVAAASKTDCENIIILLGDMPQITSDMINQMIKKSKTSPKGSIIAAAFEGKRGNPLIWPRQYFSELLELEGDMGARQIIAAHKDKVIELEMGPAARFDLDTPEAFERNP